MAPGRLDLFALGTSGQLVHRFLLGGVRSGWEPLGGVLHSEPSAIALGDGRIDLLVRSGDLPPGASTSTVSSSTSLVRSVRSGAAPAPRHPRP